MKLLFSILLYATSCACSVSAEEGMELEAPLQYASTRYVLEIARLLSERGEVVAMHSHG